MNSLESTWQPLPLLVDLDGHDHDSNNQFDTRQHQRPVSRHFFGGSTLHDSLNNNPPSPYPSASSPAFTQLFAAALSPFLPLRARGHGDAQPFNTNNHTNIPTHTTIMTSLRAVQELAEQARSVTEQRIAFLRGLEVQASQKIAREYEKASVALSMWERQIMQAETDMTTLTVWLDELEAELDADMEALIKAVMDESD